MVAALSVLKLQFWCTCDAGDILQPKFTVELIRVQWISVAGTQQFLYYHQSVALVHNSSVGLW